jgi:alkylation response protein AidB-like acyl-CoA dehydrogenase
MIIEATEVAENRLELHESLTTIYDRTAPTAERVDRADRLAAGTQETALWSRLGRDFGGVGLASPVGLGGGGAGLAELAVMFEVDGARLGCVPILGSVLVVEALLRCGDQQTARRWVPDLATGSVSGALAWTAHDVLAREGAEGGLVLDGTTSAVADAVGASVLVLPVDGDLVVVDLARAAVEQLEALDLTRTFGRVRFDATPATRLRGQPGGEVLEQVRDVAALLLATELLGVTEQALADAVAYAGHREQFGRPVGSFQALKHLLADMATAADLVRSLVEHATWAAAEAPDRLREAAAMAFLAAADVACFVTAENVQVYGGIGFSWEHPAHLFFREARADASLLGEPSRFVDRVLASAGDDCGGA